MKGVTAALPADDDPGWAYEVKWDGMRVVCDVGGRVPGAVSGHSANGLDLAGRFPELDGLVGHLGGHRAVLDGEVVAFDERHRPDFGRLQPRMHAVGPAKVAEARAHTPVTYVVFDLLELDGTPTVDLPYVDRRRLLTDLVEPAPGWTIPTHQVGHGHDLFDAVAAQGLEGVMAKRLDSPYRPGARSQAWRKVKVRRRQEVVIGGWAEGSGGRSGTIGALLVGVHDPDAPGRPLRFAGKVGTGFTDRTLADLLARLGPLARERSPFDPRPPALVARTAHWVEPVLVAEVEFAHWTGDARLRHPTYLGLRIDKDPAAVVREPEP